MINSSVKQPAKEKTILVVDDEENIRGALVELLSLAGYSVLEASSGQSALKVLDEQSVNLILSDMEMTDGDGLFLLNKIKCRNNAPPLVFISGHAEISPDSVKSMGAVDLIRKPFDVQKLIKTISSLLTAERS